jgi:hypothetical protein
MRLIRSRSGVAGRGKWRGLASVEFVIAAPLVIFTFMATVEVGRLFVQYDRLSYAVRDSARFVSENAINGTTGVVDLSDPNMILQAQNLAVYGSPQAGERPVLPEFETDDVVVESAGGDEIRVRADYTYRPLLGVPLPRIESDDEPIPLGIGLHITVTMKAIS